MSTRRSHMLDLAFSKSLFGSINLTIQTKKLQFKYAERAIAYCR